MFHQAAATRQICTRPAVDISPTAGTLRQRTPPLNLLKLATAASARPIAVPTWSEQGD